MEQGTFLSADKQTMIHFVYWLPSRQAIGTVQLIHGMSEYIERYAEFATYLTNLGYVVVGHNQLGHGASVANQNPHGYFGEQNAALVVNDVAFLNEWIVQKFSDLPHFLLGHSMGSFALRNYLQQETSALSGAILMGTGGKISALPVGLAVARTLNKRTPKKRNEWLNKMAFTAFSKKFPEKSAYNWLSKNWANVKRYEASPRMGFTFTNNGFYTLFQLIHRATSKNWAMTISKTLPIIVISGEQDPVGNFGKGPKAVCKELVDAGLVDVTLLLFSELRHEVLHECERKRVYQAIGNWLEQKRMKE